MQDLTDHYNGTSAYNKLKRGYPKFKKAILCAIEDKDRSTFWTWVRVADEKFNLRVHTYCAVD